MTGDPWDGRTLEWSIPSPPPVYNFAVVPTVQGRDEWWRLKHEEGFDLKKSRTVDEEKLRPIHMPRNSGIPFLMGFAFFVFGFGTVFNWYFISVIGAVGILLCLLARSLQDNIDYFVPVDEVTSTENRLREGLTHGFNV